MNTDTPETDGIVEQCYRQINVPTNPIPADFARHLERQRNAAWKTLKEIRELFVADESFGATVEALFEKPLVEAEAEIARLQSLLNAAVEERQ